MFRVSGKRGPWGVQAEALRKAGVHDTALHHAAYHVTLRRHLGDDWAALAGLSWSLTLGEQGVWRYRTGIERRLVGGEAALRTNTETNAGANPDARPGSESDANAVTQPPAVALVIGLVWEGRTGRPLAKRARSRRRSPFLTYGDLW